MSDNTIDKILLCAMAVAFCGQLVATISGRKILARVWMTGIIILAVTILLT